MGSEQYKREIATLQKDVAKVRTDLAKEGENASKARNAAAAKRASASRASGSSRSSYERQAEAEDKKAVAADKKVAALQGKLATLLGRVNDKERSLRSAERTEQSARDREDDRKRRREKSEQEAKDRADAKRRQTERSHAQDMARLARTTIHHVIIREPEPEKLRVLFLTANPPSATYEPLRVDTEVNNVLKALRSAKHRDLVELHCWPAATVADLVDGINDHRPHVVHFSGHADGGLLFDVGDPDAPGNHLVGYEPVARLMAATDQPPTLVVLNACRTMEGAEHMLRAAPVVIATDDTVSDASAQIFSLHFYGAIGAAQSIGHAFAQAREMVAIALLDEPDVMRITAAEGVDPDVVKLVRPR
mgnify:CR=1 FL=1